MLEIFLYGFMQRALLAGLVTALVAPSIGMFLVVRRYAFMADTLAHVSLAGVSLAAVLGIQPILSALALSLGAAAGIEGMRRKGRVVGEGALSLFLSGGLALSAVLLGFSKGSANLSSVLFGSITTVSATDLWIIGILGAFVLLFIGILFKELFACAFDEELALSSGLPARRINFLLLLAAAVTVSVSMRIVGVLLVGALMVIPVLAAMQWQRGFYATWLIAVALSLLSVLIGLFLSATLGLASGGTIVLTALALFLLSSMAGGKNAQ